MSSHIRGDLKIELGLGLPLSLADTIAAEMGVRSKRDKRQVLIATHVLIYGGTYDRRTAIADCYQGTHVVITGTRGGVFAVWPMEMAA